MIKVSLINEELGLRTLKVGAPKEYSSDTMFSNFL